MGSQDAGARPRYLIALPVFAHVEPEPFANFLACAIAAGDALSGQVHLDVQLFARQTLPKAMNAAVETVRRGDYAGLIVFDDDCTPPTDAIPKLIAHHRAGHPVVAGVGFMRNYPHTTTLGRYYPEGPSLVEEAPGTWAWTGFTWLDDLAPLPPLVRVDFCGFPVALFGRDAFARMADPIFGTMLDGAPVTHDVFFGRQAEQAGVPIVADTTLRCGHLMPAPLLTFETREMARRFTQEAGRAYPAVDQRAGHETGAAGGDCGAGPVPATRPTGDDARPGNPDVSRPTNRWLANVLAGDRG